MKNIYKTIILLFVSVFTFYSCETVGSLDDVETNGVIPIDQVYQDVNLIRLAVTGAYASVRTLLPLPSNVSGMSVSAQPNAFFLFGLATEANINAIQPNNTSLTNIYSGGYKAVGNANEIINNIPNSVLNDTEKQSVIGEAKFIRAISHFYLLRTFGQFYDLNSEFGITIDPFHPDGLTRNTVQETYDHILADLDAAIASGIPQMASDPSRASVEAAKAFKAKVLLFMVRYDEAATLATELLGLTLAPDYKQIFIDAYQSSDALFASATDFDNAINFGGGYTEGFIPGSNYLNGLHFGESDFVRLSTASPSSFANLNGFKFSFDNTNPPAWMHMRIPEVWLIYAEASARVAIANGGTIADVSVAVDKLNEIRNRVGLGPKSPADLDDFLDMIRIEKLLELYFETGEDWYDFVRYITEGDLTLADLSALKPLVTNVDQFIFPIPLNEVELSEGAIQQNPGYN
ncbi:RagB/SusD family nutrient uptake outer membrane protein [Flavivirga sp. 57AJ16]|uniref:RagB/SusD family nutrient uptake outer membrane protein n=1 Tax=Flavivirga sp. 57AJ16 TaxID=3025307 RepID=UPI0023659A3B|nr:RagB/SusD family nutrient uptake outer membrane protein [Flavivirga sp. 57AJ16]MDD7885488.1 RagB/SusD family nutrient uptake outer membrane protein [Flavivirga sp. 57AJ16]